MSTADTTSSDKSKETTRSADAERLRKAPATRRRGWLKAVVLLLCVAAAAGGGAWYWWQQQLNALPPEIAKANGRLEAEQVEIAAKYSGRIADVLVKEGDFVTPGEVLSHMDIATLEAQRREARAQLERATIAVRTAQSVLIQRQAEREAAA